MVRKWKCSVKQKYYFYYRYVFVIFISKIYYVVLLQRIKWLVSLLCNYSQIEWARSCFVDSRGCRSRLVTTFLAVAQSSRTFCVGGALCSFDIRLLPTSSGCCRRLTTVQVQALIHLRRFFARLVIAMAIKVSEYVGNALANRLATVFQLLQHGMSIYI